MHKSLGNGVDPLDMIKKYGADLVRLWVASADYQVDVRASDNIFKQLSEAYRKIRNTARILLANLGEGENAFNPDRDMVPCEKMYEIDRWALARFNDLVKECRRGYNEYEFHAIYHAITNFCTTELSKLYVDITKDRVYTEKKDSEARLSALSAMYLILSGLTRLLAPILSFTAEEIWQAMPHAEGENSKSVFLNLMPTCDETLAVPEIADRWNRMLDLRDDMMKALELARAEKMIGKSLDAAITVYTEDEGIFELLSGFGKELATVTITSAATVIKGAAPVDPAVFTETVSGIAVKVMPAEGVKCDRCWAFTTDSVSDGEGCLCARCNAIVNG
jgi:isoleucyl-tRNA synthetase